ncbi:hypothetical protein RCO48_28235 [Peribacillus frigoritolerans]|nr:hypothetical protein [Peribacillus frigoritolerans]
MSFFVAVGLTSTTASAVASGTSASRILYAMGRENVLPKKNLRLSITEIPDTCVQYFTHWWDCVKRSFLKSNDSCITY